MYYYPLFIVFEVMCKVFVSCVICVVWLSLVWFKGRERIIHFIVSSQICLLNVILYVIIKQILDVVITRKPTVLTHLGQSFIRMLETISIQ